MVCPITQGDHKYHDNIHGVVIMTKAIARVYPVHLMNADWAPGGRQPSDQANRLTPQDRR